MTGPLTIHLPYAAGSRSRKDAFHDRREGRARPGTDPPGGGLGGERLDWPEPGLRIGSEANLVVFDRDDRWDVTEEALRSRGRNTPLLGRSLPGRVLVTIDRGRIAWTDPAED